MKNCSPLVSNDPAPLRRRGLLAGAGAAGAAALAAQVLPGAAPEAAAPTAVAARKPLEPRTGYRLSDHVRRYYDTTRT